MFKECIPQLRIKSDVFYSMVQSILITSLEYIVYPTLI